MNKTIFTNEYKISSDNSFQGHIYFSRRHHFRNWSLSLFYVTKRKNVIMQTVAI